MEKEMNRACKQSSLIRQRHYEETVQTTVQLQKVMNCQHHDLDSVLDEGGYTLDRYL